jgi:peptide/nickel transport system ATP-binding protein
MSPVLSLSDLRTQFSTERGQVKAVDGVSLDIGEGETVGLVGESGSGKSVTALSAMGLVDDPGRIVDGEVTLRSPSLAETFRERYASPRFVDGRPRGSPPVRPRRRDEHDISGPDDLTEPGAHRR